MRRSRNRLSFALGVVLVVALAVFVPAVLYFTELALRQLRMMWWLILLLAGTVWLLSSPGRKE